MPLRPERYHYGATVDLTADFYDRDEALIDPDGVTLEIIDPWGAKTTYTYQVSAEITREDVGNYLAQIIPDKPGRWFFRWAGTNGSIVGVMEGHFEVMGSIHYDRERHDYGYGNWRWH